MGEPPVDLNRYLAILVLRTAGCSQDMVASIMHCAKSKLVEVERWFSGQLPYQEAAKLCNDIAIKRMINLELVPAEEVDERLLEKMMGITGDNILRRYRRDYLEVVEGYRNVDEILPTLGPERWRKTWYLYKVLDWDEERIANKLRNTIESVRHDKKKFEEELVRSKTKEETKVKRNQFMLNLPFWVNQAQLEHLKEEKQQDERPGIDIITYPGGFGIRQQLESFRGHFRDINPQYRPFWHPLDEVVLTQLQGHLPDKAFWSTVKDFSKKDGECCPLLDTAYERFISGGEELEPLQPRRGPTPSTYTTSRWGDTLIVCAFLGIKGELYSPHTLTDGNFLLDYDGHPIYCGPDPVAAEQKHRQLAEDFRQTDEFNAIVSLMEELRDLRQQIIARIDECLRKSEYYLYHCPDCPAEQYRKMLASKGE